MQENQNGKRYSMERAQKLGLPEMVAVNDESWVKRQENKMAPLMMGMGLEMEMEMEMVQMGMEMGMGMGGEVNGLEMMTG